MSRDAFGVERGELAKYARGTITQETEQARIHRRKARTGGVVARNSFGVAGAALAAKPVLQQVHPKGGAAALGAAGGAVAVGALGAGHAIYHTTRAARHQDRAQEARKQRNASLGKSAERKARDTAAVGLGAGSAVAAREARHEFHVARASRGQQRAMRGSAADQASTVRQHIYRQALPSGTPGSMPRVDSNAVSLARKATGAHRTEQDAVAAGRRAFQAARRGGKAAAIGVGLAGAAGVAASGPRKRAPKAPKYQPVSYR